MPAPVPLGEHEVRPDPQSLTASSDPSNNSSTGVNYEPNPSTSLKVSPEREEIVRKITNLYCGSASEEDMQVYAAEAVYDDPWSFCDTRYKIAGQWYGMSLFFLFFSFLFLSFLSIEWTHLHLHLQWPAPSHGSCETGYNQLFCALEQ